MLIKSQVPYVFGLKPNKMVQYDGTITTELIPLYGKQKLGLYLFGDEQTHSVCINIINLSVNPNGYMFKYVIKDDNLVHGYQNVALCTTYISLGLDKLDHRVIDKYNDCFKPEWKCFEKFFRYLTGWPIFTTK